MQPAVITQLKLIQNHGAETNGPIRFRLTGKNGVATGWPKLEQFLMKEN